MRESAERTTRRMSAFEVWLRTGHRIDVIEHKFNPWHDPRDGRFTFKSTGRWTGGGFTGGGGGSMGGGGASGSWNAPAPVRRARPVAAKTPREMRHAAIVAGAAKAGGQPAASTVSKPIDVPIAAPAPDERATWRHTEANGYEYEITQASGRGRSRVAWS